MPKDEWGVKRICPTTGQRFYDLKKTPIISPYTGERVVLDANTRTRVAAVEKPEAKEEADDLTDNVDLLDDDDDASDSDSSDELLEDDDDDTVSLDEIADVPADDDEN
ncbi:MAG: TIGR02300 family protein [Marinosulfonomonas sp.]|nr:TIGR02300 family protein [Marinosulfonomonas sp.]